MPVFTRLRQQRDTPLAEPTVDELTEAGNAPAPLDDENTPAAADGEEPPHGPPAPDDESSGTGGAGGKQNEAEGEAEAEKPPLLRWTLTTLSAALILTALLLPNSLAALRPDRFTRIPAEAIVGAAILLALPRRPRTITAALFGAALGALTILNVLDMGFREYLGRGFNLVLDWSLLDDAQAYMKDSMGAATTLTATIGTVLLAVLLLVLTALAAVRLSNNLAAHKQQATKATLIAGTVWITCSALGLQLAGLPIASDRAASALAIQARRVQDTLRDEAAFAKEAKADAFGATPPGQLLPDLRGKDVIFTFIESYGRSAIEDPVMAPGVTSTLDARTKSLEAAGYKAKSGWLTSATYGGSSWLGHSTFLSGLWIDNQQRYRTVTSGGHLTLTKAFQKTGAWDTVGIMPGIQKGWPEGDFYGLDKVYDAFHLGYRGPKFSWSTMPDQYTLEAFQRMVHGKKRDKPLMSEIILTSSHQPWAPIPKMADWDDLGDGSLFDAVQKDGKKPQDIITDTTKSREEYGKSIEYSVTSLTEWLERYGTEDTVLVFLGDHQPIARVSGNNAGRDVPISIVAKDPKVLDKITAWNWTDGLQPSPGAPVWKMDTFRDRFLKAYGSTPHPRKD
ncbi:CDP-alcohol phosphatidyltransferase [Streptomyces sp. P17]|uniref:CDP-alcohol phosphatidyltransferase n=1 Tax=Streptomyces sp. P17 TaxID=3074716 RepID=UPI0028F42CB3|nr:CDP-alcohol phosphatidyltransferase [Streptomyces sp. P17]MDT9698049.1 CDP-alcohol phosphatidyltransferase [Streptomyces sp. P17]